jgi:hypothetical protein
MWLVAILIPVAFAAPVVFDEPVEIKTFSVNGESVELKHTDENTNEELIIRTTADTFGGWDEISFFFSIENTDVTQDVDIQFIHGDEIELLRIEELAEDVAKDYVVNVYGDKIETCKDNWVASTTVFLEDNIDGYFCGDVFLECSAVNKTNCTLSDEFLGTTTVQRTSDEWQPLRKDTAVTKVSRKSYESPLERKKQVTGYTIATGETKYFKALFDIPNQRTRQEFYIEAFGNQGAYGTLR